jgi:hypothetical protein
MQWAVTWGRQLLLQVSLDLPQKIQTFCLYYMGLKTN